MASKTTPAWHNNFTKSYALMVVGILAFSAALGGLWLGVQSLAENSSEWLQRAAGHGFQAVLLLLLFGGVTAWTWWSRREKIVVSVTDDGLTVNTRSGDVYSFSDPKLGTWGVTGGAPLTIGCRDSASGLALCFSWPDNVPTENARADYEVSGTEWLTLVEKFGLASYLARRG